GILAKRNDDALWPRFDLFDMRLPAQSLDRDQLHQLLDFAGQWPKTVDQLGRETLDLGIGLQRREAAVEAETQVEIFDIILGDRYRRAKRDRRRPSLLGGFLDARLQGFDRLAQHVLIEFIADFLDMAGLFIAKQISGAANIEVMACKFKPGAERVERLQ